MEERLLHLQHKIPFYAAQNELGKLWDRFVTRSAQSIRPLTCTMESIRTKMVATNLAAGDEPPTGVLCGDWLMVSLNVKNKII